MRVFIHFIKASILYAIIDIAWNFGPGLPIQGAIHRANGTDLSFMRSLTSWGGAEIIALVVFFLLIGYANARLAIVPGIEARSVRVAVKRSFVLGCAAYATYAAPIFVMINNWPFILVPFDILVGGGLSVATSAIITALALRRQR